MSRRDTTMPSNTPVISHHSASTDALWCGPVRSAIGSPADSATGKKDRALLVTAPVVANTWIGGADMSESIRRRRSYEERFREKVRYAGPDDCWEWLAGRSPNGYGAFQRPDVSDRVMGAHRVAWELANGPIPPGLWVLHRCDNKSCVNPAHLFLGTHQDNVDDKVAKGRQARGERIRSDSVLNPDRVRYMRRRAAEGARVTDLAIEFGIGKSAVSAAIRGLTWRHVA